MSDWSQLMKGQLSPVGFVRKQLANLVAWESKAPVEVQNAITTFRTDAEEALGAAAQWGDTSAEAYITKNSDNFATEVANLLSGITGGSTTVDAKTADAVTAAKAVLLGIFHHEAAKLINTLVPAAPQAVAAAGQTTAGNGQTG